MNYLKKKCHCWKIFLTICFYFSLFTSGLLFGQGAKISVTQTKLLDFKGWGILPANYDRQLPTYADGSQAWGDASWLSTGTNITKYHQTICDLGFNIARTYISPTIGKSDFTIDFVRLQDLKDHLTILRNLGIPEYVITVWSPPAYMKSPDAVRYGKYQGREQTLNPEYADGVGYDYTDFLVAVMLELKKSGFKMPLSMAIQNEPEISQNYDGCVYDRTEAQKNVWRAVVKQLRKKLDENGLNEILIHGPDVSGFNNLPMFFGTASSTGFSLLNSDNELNNAIGAFSFHTYFTSGNIGTLVKAIAAYPNKEVWMHETCTESTIRPELRPQSGINQLNWTLNNVRRMAGDLIDLHTNYWFFWRGYRLSSSEGDQDLIYGSDSNPIKTKSYYVFQKLWKTTGPGWKVMKMTSSDATLRTDNSNLINSGSGDQWSAPVDLLAMQDPTNSKTCIMIVNNASTSKTIQTIDGLKGDNADIFVTDPMGDMDLRLKRTITNGTLDGGSFQIPAYSVTIIVSPSNGEVTKATGLKLNPTSATLDINSEKQIVSTVSPIGVSNKLCKWSSNNESVAKVNDYGLVKAISDGTAVITATTDDGGFTASCTFTVKKPIEQAPYNGKMAEIPGTIEAENYDIGGQNVAYNDTDPTNSGGGYRSDGVDIGANPTGFGIGWMTNGEWAKYTVNVSAAGTYTIDALVACPNDAQKFHIMFDGIDKTGLITVSNTGSWSTWKTVTKTNVNLNAGKQIMQVYFDGGFNFDKLKFTSTNTSASEKLNLDQINTIYPNPASKNIHLTSPDMSGQFNYRVTDLSGKVLINEKVMATEVDVDIQNLYPGIYLITEETSNKTVTFKLIKQ